MAHLFPSQTVTTTGDELRPVSDRRPFPERGVFCPHSGEAGSGRGALRAAHLGQEVELDLLDLHSAPTGWTSEVVDLLVQVPDLQLRLEVHLVIVLATAGGPWPPGGSGSS